VRYWGCAVWRHVAVYHRGEALVEGLPDEQGHRGEGEYGQQQGEGEQHGGEEAAEQALPGARPVVGEGRRPADGVLAPERERDERRRVQHQGDEPRQQPETVLFAVPGHPSLAPQQISETHPEIAHGGTVSGPCARPRGAVESNGPAPPYRFEGEPIGGRSVE